MRSLKSWRQRIVNMMIALVMVFAFLLLLVTTPFYARGVLWALNKVPVTVNQIAAASQKKGDGIQTEDQPEPGSPAAIAAASEAAATQQKIEKQQRQVGKLKARLAAAKLKADKHHKHHHTLVEVITAANAEMPKQKQPDTDKPNADKNSVDKNSNEAHVIVVLGGGLAWDASHHMVVNEYTRMRLEQALIQKQHNPLPILLSGREAPYMQQWLQQHGMDARLLEDQSLNTCENTRFSALLLQKKGGAPRVELVTDEYHMPRARRLFAINGIDTIPVVAPLPDAATAWQPSLNNIMHSRRATYEAIATLRDLWVGQADCREVP